MSRVHPARVPESGVVGLLAVVLTGVPRLDGAAWVGVRGRFHEAERGSRIRIAECVAVCPRCPVKAECGRWADSEPDLVGVVAGECRGGVRAELEDRDEHAALADHELRQVHADVQLHPEGAVHDHRQDDLDRAERRLCHDRS